MIYLKQSAARAVLVLPAFRLKLFFLLSEYNFFLCCHRPLTTESLEIFLPRGVGLDHTPNPPSTDQSQKLAEHQRRKGLKRHFYANAKFSTAAQEIWTPEKFLMSTTLYCAHCLI